MNKKSHDNLRGLTSLVYIYKKKTHQQLYSLSQINLQLFIIEPQILYHFTNYFTLRVTINDITLTTKDFL